jgi:S1-C subfamily serine protease
MGGVFKPHRVDLLWCRTDDGEIVLCFTNARSSLLSPPPKKPMSAVIAKRALLACLIFCFGQAHGENWSAVATTQSGETEHYIDFDSIRKDGNYVTAWFREKLSKPIFRGLFKSAGHVRLTQNAFDCKRRAMATVRIIVRGEQGDTLDDHTIKPLDIKFDGVVPGSTGAHLVSAVCDGKAEEKAAITKEVNAFATDPAHPFFDEVSDDIIAILKTGASLAEAYEKAVWANPVTRQKEIARRQKEKDAKPHQEAKNYNPDDPPTDAFAKYSWRFIGNAESDVKMYLGSDSVVPGTGEYKAMVFLFSRSDYPRPRKIEGGMAGTLITRWVINCKTRVMVQGNSAYFDSNGKFLSRSLESGNTTLPVTENSIGAIYTEAACGSIQTASPPQPRDSSSAGKESKGGFGTAWLSDTGYLITAYHVIEGARKFSILLPDKSVISAQVVGIRPAADTFHDMTEAVTLREKPIAECGDETSGARNKPGAVAGRD